MGDDEAEREIEDVEDRPVTKRHPRRQNVHGASRLAPRPPSARYARTRTSSVPPTVRFTTAGIDDELQNASIAAAPNSMTAAPHTMTRTSRATACNEAMRVRSPGATTLQPRASPAPPERTIAPSSSEPWPTT